MRHRKPKPIPVSVTRARIVKRSPEVAAHLLALEAAGLMRFGDNPDYIVGGIWPTTTPDAVRSNCANCGHHVTLSPDSGLAMSIKFPDVPILCWECAERLALEKKL